MSSPLSLVWYNYTSYPLIADTLTISPSAHVGSTYTSGNIPITSNSVAYNLLGSGLATLSLAGSLHLRFYDSIVPGTPLTSSTACQGESTCSPLGGVGTTPSLMIALPDSVIIDNTNTSLGYVQDDFSTFIGKADHSKGISIIGQGIAIIGKGVDIIGDNIGIDAGHTHANLRITMNPTHYKYWILILVIFVIIAIMGVVYYKSIKKPAN